ncbi:5-dehydro-4-deoxy-D-glucuronate isomerase [Rikenella microfusus]|uniref:4-deoxy-L-threo-5-hexosulose-uronate ketol-isomerase n=1 Tax=Rikenella microfusus TaxID=28139 RepID=A0A379MRU5_9BACT|nr:5-dehydro-4-deoxy-D-glucuronate isomerase [Rikenella microfusus]SUE34454.1 4-deoxy-L-threo-5-hexosulose-uronate ketol-isomerase [Rikenella microfusus]
MSDVKYEMRYASHPADAKSYDTERLRAEYLFADIMTEGEINLIYSAYDRLIVGGAVPTARPLTLDAIPPLRADRFLHRRELGIINVGGAGTVKAGDKEYRLDYKEALYLGKSDRDITFASDDAARPARFYFNSAPAHAEYPDKKITKADAVVVELGSLEESNHRVINKMIVNQVLPTCQLQMGMTELKPGSVWNTMPAHTHDRRMEAYFYFELPDDQAVCHFMGQPQETRHIWMRNRQAVISPQWSIHSACATHNYTFIWGMAGENMDYGDMDGCATTELK